MRNPTALGLLSLALGLAGCSTAEFDATNARLANSRLLFVHDQKYDVLAPPLFASPGELDAHLAGRTDAYERRFQALFPDEQETWLARFRPIEQLREALQRETSPEPEGSASSDARAAGALPPRTYYVVPIEGAELTIVQQVEQLVRAAGFECVANKPGDATRLPMPPAGGPAPQ